MGVRASWAARIRETVVFPLWTGPLIVISTGFLLIICFHLLYDI
jgi:hypothetical protein